MTYTVIASAFLISYLVGSTPFGFILTKLFTKKDIRSLGSGSTGATNVLRSSNKILGYITFTLDALKGVASIYIVTKLFSIESLTIIYYCSLCAIIGHIFPIWLKFKGGKGVATLIGILLHHSILLGLCLMCGWYIVFYITRIVSISSIILMSVIIVFFALKLDITYSSFVIAAILIIIKHRENITRIIQGQEHSFKK